MWSVVALGASLTVVVEAELVVPSVVAITVVCGRMVLCTKKVVRAGAVMWTSRAVTLVPVDDARFVDISAQVMRHEIHWYTIATTEGCEML